MKIYKLLLDKVDLLYLLSFKEKNFLLVFIQEEIQKKTMEHSLIVTEDYLVFLVVKYFIGTLMNKKNSRVPLLGNGEKNKK